MAFFGGFGFFMAYFQEPLDLKFLYPHVGFAIFIYRTFYVTIFGRDETRWMFINSALGVFGIYAQLNWFLARFGKSAADYSWKVHLVPVAYYVLYTFLLRQFVLDITRSRDKPERRAKIEWAYVALSLLVYGVIWWRVRPTHELGSGHARRHATASPARIGTPGTPPKSTSSGTCHGSRSKVMVSALRGRP